MSKYLDDTGLGYVWGKIKTALGTKQDSLVFTTVSIPASSWSNSRATVTVSGVTTTNHLICSPAPDNMSSTVYAYSQTTNSVTFACTTTPTAAVTMNIFIVN